jgi:hypothetical protein
MLIAYLVREVHPPGFVGARHFDGQPDLLREHLDEFDPVRIAGGLGDAQVELHVLLHAIDAGSDGFFNAPQRMFDIG